MIADRATPILLLTFIFMLFFATSAKSNTLGYSIEQSLLVSSNDQVIGSSLGYLRSQTEDFYLTSATDVKDLFERFDGKWQPNKTDIPNFGYSQDTFLFHIQLKNDSVNTISRYLEIGYPVLEEVDVYLYTVRGSFEHYKFGGGRRFGERPVKHRNFLAPIEVYAKNKVHIFVRVKSYSSVQVPIRLILPQQLFEEEQSSLLINGIYLGLMISLLFYNLLLYFSVGDRNYLFYVGNVFIVMMVQGGLQGYTFMYIWPDTPKVTYYYMPFTISAAGFVMSIFVSRFLELKLNYRRLYYVFKFTTYFLLFSSLSVFILGYEFAIKSGFIANFLLIFLAQGAGFYVWLKGYRPARFFTIAYLSFFLGTLTPRQTAINYKDSKQTAGLKQPPITEDKALTEHTPKDHQNRRFRLTASAPSSLRFKQ